jgi:AcrR family transcriptional regulator
MEKQHKRNNAAKQKLTAPNPASTGSLQATPERILEGAREVLIRQGYSKFTTRSVAAAVGISPGNLAYHFPSKQMLLRGVVDRLVTDYSRQFEALLTEEDQDLGSGQDFVNLVRWLLTDAIKEDTVRVFRELWTISLHDEETRKALDDMYDNVMAGVVDLLHKSFPSVELHKLQEIIQLLALASEGSIVLFGTRRERAVSYERMIDFVTQLIEFYVPELGLKGSE